MNYLTRINFLLRLGLGGLFLVYGAAKIGNPAAFSLAIGNFHLLPHSLNNGLAITLPWIEVAAGLLLILGIWKRASAILIGLMLVVFLIAVAQAMYRGFDISCGCAGTLTGDKVGFKKLAEDAVYLISALWLAYWYKDEAKGELN